MKSKILLISTILFFTFCFIVLLKSLNNSNIYSPEIKLEKTLINFDTKDLFTKKKISSNDVFVNSRFYVLNIWSSWCLPCREEHSELMQLGKNKSLKLIGLNYKDSSINAKNFINEFGNPYNKILTDENGIIAIELGAYGVPETFIINQDKVIVKRFIGPLNRKSLKEINLILK